MEFSAFLEVKGHKCQLSLLGIKLACTDAQSVKVCQSLSKSVKFCQFSSNVKELSQAEAAVFSLSLLHICSTTATLQHLSKYLHIDVSEYLKPFCYSKTWVLINFSRKGCCCILVGAFPWDLVNKTQMDSSLGSLNSQMGRLEFKKVLFSIFILLGWLLNQHFKRMKNMPKVIVKLLSIKYAIKVELPRTIWDSNLKLGWSAV